MSKNLPQRHRDTKKAKGMQRKNRSIVFLQVFVAVAKRSDLKLGATLVELIENLGRFLQFSQWTQLFVDVVPVEFGGLPDNHALNIYPILAATGEGF